MCFQLYYFKHDQFQGQPEASKHVCLTRVMATTIDEVEQRTSKLLSRLNTQTEYRLTSQMRPLTRKLTA